MTVLYSNQATKFLNSLSKRDQDKILHEMDLIDSGMSIEYDKVRNEHLRVASLRGPFRAKFMHIGYARGGVRSIFYFTSEKTLVAIVQYRNADPYNDGG